jgi:hypothetical protein
MAQSSTLGQATPQASTAVGPAKPPAAELQTPTGEPDQPAAQKIAPETSKPQCFWYYSN